MQALACKFFAPFAFVYSLKGPVKLQVCRRPCGAFSFFKALAALFPAFLHTGEGPRQKGLFKERKKCYNPWLREANRRCQLTPGLHCSAGNANGATRMKYSAPRRLLS